MRCKPFGPFDQRLFIHTLYGSEKAFFVEIEIDVWHTIETDHELMANPCFPPLLENSSLIRHEILLVIKMFKQ